MEIKNEIEIWKSLDFLGYPDYEVSTFGRVKSLNYKGLGIEGILKPSKDKCRYMRVILRKNKKGKSFLVHRLVAKCFLEPIEGKDIINHIDENPSNNNVENLEFCDIRYNNNYGTANERRSKKMKGKNKGKQLLEETKQKISESLKGKPKSEEHKQKLSIAKKGENSYWYGKPKSEEHKQKLSIANKGKGIKPILQYTKDNVFIREWDSATTASTELNISNTLISSCCRGKIKSAYGYIWKYKE